MILRNQFSLKPSTQKWPLGTNKKYPLALSVFSVWKGCWSPPPSSSTEVESYWCTLQYDKQYVFIGPKSDHSLLISLTHSQSSLLKLEWSDPLLRLQNNCPQWQSQEWSCTRTLQSQVSFVNKLIDKHCGKITPKGLPGNIGAQKAIVRNIILAA